MLSTIFIPYNQIEIELNLFSTTTYRYLHHLVILYDCLLCLENMSPVFNISRLNDANYLEIEL